MITAPDEQARDAEAASAGAAAGAREACAHCGQLVIGTRIRDGLGDLFCCEGCRSVHGWLRSARMDGYYNLLEQNGKMAPQAFIGEQYRAFLESLGEPGALAGLGRWRDGRHALTLECGEISCAGCGWLLERLLQGKAGVRTFDVDFIHGEAFLEYDPGEIPLQDILAIPAGFGYRLKPKRGDGNGRPVPDRALLYRLAVSGACFANAMAFSLAVYLGAFKGMPKPWADAFGLLGILISIPAVAYAAFPFFHGAWNALKAGRFNIDVTVSIGIALSSALTLSSLQGGGDTNFSDSLTGLIFFLLLGRWTVRRFEAGLALKGRWFDALKPGRIRVRRGDAIESLDGGEVREGDLVEVSGGEYAPLDGALVSDEAWMDTSLLTGESHAARFRFGDAVFAGYLNVRGRIAIRAAGRQEDTRIAGLSRKLDHLLAGRRSLPDGVGRVAKWFTLAVIASGLATLAWHWQEGPARALGTAASVFIISCSCALALAAPISRGMGLKRAMAMGFHFRAQTSLEALRAIRCVLFDKTGTLTFMRRAVSEWEWIDSPGARALEKTEILQAIKALSRRSLHPVAVSLFRALEAAPDGELGLLESREVPHFGMVGTLSTQAPKGTLQGAGPFRPSDTVELCICRQAAWEGADGEFARLGYASPPESVSPSGSAVAADTCVFLDGILVARIRFTDEIKPDARSLASGLRAMGVVPVLLSGDNPGKVDAFAVACGFEFFHSSLTPEDKGRWAEEYRKRFGPCLAVGDGFNDNLLFGASELAMAVHGGAVDISKGTDILFAGPHPSDLVRLFDLAGKVRRSIVASYWVSGVYNGFAIAAAMAGGVSPLFAALLMPMSSLSLCLVALLAISSPREGRPSRPRS